MTIHNGISFVGVFVLLGFAWILSEQKRSLNVRLIVWGIILQFCVALFIFVAPYGTHFFVILNGWVIHLLDVSSAGAQFVFGRLALAPGQVSEAGAPSLGFILAFQAFPTIIFFSALISILYYFNIMQKVVRFFARIFSTCMRISGAEALVAASNIFVGIEAALTVKPHLKNMTRSEICTILTVGMATVASNVLALYVFCLRAQFATIAGHLISASLLSAPAALIMSKILVPETETPETLGMTVEPSIERESSLFETIITGANAGVKMIVGITALLIAVVGLVAVCDSALSCASSKVLGLFGIVGALSFTTVLSYLFHPFVLLMGVQAADAGQIATLVAERLIVTEVVAYQHLGDLLTENVLHHQRSAVIATYALCGFAHFASMAIFAGGLSALIPHKTAIIARVAPRALVAATLACFLTACVVGVCYTGNTVLFAGF